jgi:hypothetical protein
VGEASSGGGGEVVGVWLFVAWNMFLCLNQIWGTCMSVYVSLICSFCILRLCIWKILMCFIGSPIFLM